MEMWREIPGYEGIYEASNLGNIRSCEGKTTYTEHHGIRRWKQRVLKQRIQTKRGGRSDARVSLWRDGKEKTWLVARLIGMAWCSGYAEWETINHINGDSLDNRAENLEWVSVGENIRKGFETGLYSSVQDPVQLWCDGVTFNFASKAEASRFIGRSHSYVSNCMKLNRPITTQDGQGCLARCMCE